jgi:uncharacterized protein YoxC
MTTPHTHDASPHDWSWDRMIRHLRDEHGIQPPMVWTLADVHHAHLQAHRNASTEETPVPEQHTHEPDLTSWHAETETHYGTDVTQFLAEHLIRVHGLLNTGGMDLDGLKGLHVMAHSELGTAPDNHAATLNTLKRAMYGLWTEIARLREERDRIQRGNQRNVESIDALEAQLADHRAAVQQTQQKLDRALEERDEAREERDQIREALMRKLGDAARLRARLAETMSEDPSLRMADAHEPEGEEDAPPTKAGDLRAARLRAVDDDAPRLGLDDTIRQLTLEIPAGTVRLMLTFVPEEG